ncbi:MAG: hypothetical protein LBC70_05865 [Chitinispirillales bacterium]|jgi:hypothetical protein|nr:hypothetical protein [Chitinispirillales bacterium]
MLMTFDEVSKKIVSGGLLHIAGAENLLRKLPKGNWTGGSTRYFMAKEGGKVTDELLFVTEFPYGEFTIKSYDVYTIFKIAAEAYGNGFSIIIVPFDSDVHKLYAEKAAGFEDMFLKNIAGWVAGAGQNPNVAGQTPITVNGQTGEVFTDKAAVLHVRVPEDREVECGVVNIFSQDESSPVIEFPVSGFSVSKCLINGEETVFTDYLAKNGIDMRLPLVGDHSGNGVNVSFKSIGSGTVSFYAPVFSGIKYKIAKPVADYTEEFSRRLSGLNAKTVFSCNCVLNFLYGELEGKSMEHFTGPITFGEIAYQLVNQTLVYVSVT